MATFPHTIWYLIYSSIPTRNNTQIFIFLDSVRCLPIQGILRDFRSNIYNFTHFDIRFQSFSSQFLVSFNHCSLKLSLESYLSTIISLQSYLDGYLIFNNLEPVIDLRVAGKVSVSLSSLGETATRSYWHATNTIRRCRYRLIFNTPPWLY